jgi:hypothetical protein
MMDLVYRLMSEASYPVIAKSSVNDVGKEGEGDDTHIILTLDTPQGYRVVRLDVTDLGEDYLEHA